MNFSVTFEEETKSFNDQVNGDGDCPLQSTMGEDLFFERIEILSFQIGQQFFKNNKYQIKEEPEN